MRRIRFFALKDDLLPVLQHIESKGSLRYTRFGHFPTPQCGSFVRAAEIPNLGIAKNESSIGCDMYLVAEMGVAINTRRIERNSGEVVFSVDQLLNPDTVCFRPGGLWRDEIVLDGEVATVSDTNRAQDLMKRFKSGVRKHFTSVRGTHVGAKALEMLRAGKRLTLAEQSPPQFDLTEIS